MSFTKPLQDYHRTPFPALPGSQQKWLEEELRKLERTEESIVEALKQLEPLTAFSMSGPVFAAGRITTNQSITASTFTKAQLNSVIIDTASAWDETNYRFQPMMAGYYQVNGTIQFTFSGPVGLVENVTAIYKNGTEVAMSVTPTYSGTRGSAAVSTVVYLNGTDDYIELYGQCSGTSPTISQHTGGSRSQMSVHFIRA